MSDDSRTSLPAADPAGGPDPGEPAPRRAWRICRGIAARATSPSVAAVLAVVAFGLIGILALLEHGHLFIDLAVYRAGGQAWLDARPLYDSPFPTGLPGQLLPFIYPPFAALCFVPLTLPPPALVSVVFTLGSVAALLVTVRVVGAAVHPGFRWPHAVLFGCLALTLEPVWQTLSLGQINLYLMALVVVDLLAIRDVRGRGLLIGLAAAFKLTPAVFLLYLVAARQWRAVANSGVAFGAVSVLALLARPSESVTYWWRALGAPTQIGDLGYAGNQSVRGALHRLGWTHAVELTCWVAVVALVLVVTGLALRRWRAGGFGAGGLGVGGFGAGRSDSAARPDSAARAGLAARADSAALVLVALAGVLISPISWSHHWVWLVPALLVLGHFAVRQRSVPLVATTVLIVLVTVIPAHRLLPSEHHREFGWSVLQHLAGDTYLWLGLVLLVVLYGLSSAGLHQRGRRGTRSAGERGLA